MWLQFFSQNAHFAINLFAALVSMGICWLYLDAWTSRHHMKELCKWVGFGLLGVSFLVEATIIEQSVLGKSVLGHWSVVIALITRLMAYAAIITGQLIDSLQVVPKNPGLTQDEATSPAAKPTAPSVKDTTEEKKAPGVVVLLSISSKLFVPIGGFAIAALYWRRATIGLERHYKPVAKAFLLFAISDLIGLVSLLRNTTNPVLYTWVAAFGWVWWLEQLTLLVGVVILGLWIWGYLLERFFSQLFMILMSMVVIVFLFMSVGFTGLLLRNIESDSLVNLRTASNVLSYALTSKQGETTSAAEQLSGSTDIVSAIASHDREKLIQLTANYLSEKKLTGLIITNQSGQVLLRAQDAEQWGDSLSGDALIKRALVGLNQSTVTVLDGVSSPIVQVRSAVAIKDSSGNLVGSVITSLNLDSAFVAGIKKATGLQSSVYSSNALAATTLLASDGKTHPVGVKFTDKKVKDRVFKKGQAFSGAIRLQNKQMLAVFAPVKDVDNVPVGMLMVARPQSAILLTAGHSVEITFVLMVLLLALSIYPILLVVKVLVRQIG